MVRCGMGTTFVVTIIAVTASINAARQDRIWWAVFCMFFAFFEAAYFIWYLERWLVIQRKGGTRGAES